MSDIHTDCLQGPDGCVFCPVGGKVTREQMVREIAEVTMEEIAEIDEAITSCHMRPKAPCDAEWENDEISHIVCRADVLGAEPYWWYGV